MHAENVKVPEMKKSQRSDKLQLQNELLKNQYQVQVFLPLSLQTSLSFIFPITDRKKHTNTDS